MFPVHTIGHVLVHQIPHLVHFSWEKGTEIYDEMKEQQLKKAAEEGRSSLRLLTVTDNGSGDRKQLRATAVARHRADTLGVDLSQVEASGPGGIITFEDVQRFSLSRSS
jgi:pyruvate/2-oxoglutarate dehydrogenase complex dihydrolipoamide acyltransferase (E2) component